jgi:dGTPase
MTEKLTETYLDFEGQLLAGTLNDDLLGCLPQPVRELTARINEYSVTNIYNYKSVVEIEIAGYHVIGGLLDAFVNAVLQPDLPKSKKLIKLVSKQFPLRLSAGHLYTDMLSLLDFIAGMTDLYALDLYRKITGIVIPELR